LVDWNYVDSCQLQDSFVVVVVDDLLEDKDVSSLVLLVEAAASASCWLEDGLEAVASSSLPFFVVVAVPSFVESLAFFVVVDVAVASSPFVVVVVHP
jgi:hypothetical protein